MKSRRTTSRKAAGKRSGKGSNRVKRTHKDSLFRDLFGSKDRKEYTLSLYNALNGSNYTDPNVIDINTLRGVLYVSVKNDVSFLIDDHMVLWEHQSSHNPNMPLRGLSYFARLYASWAKKNQVRIYDSTPVAIPVPQYVVFFVGEGNRPEREILRLSDLFVRDVRAEGKEPALEVAATVLNINEGKNRELAQACEALAGYAHFLALLREERKNGSSIDEAVDCAISTCIADGYLVDYFAERRAEVRDILLGEMTEAERRELDEHARLRYGEERFAQGRREGEEKGRREEIAHIADAVRSGVLTVDRAVNAFRLTEEELAELQSRLS